MFYENLYLCVCNQGHIVVVIDSMLYFYVCHQEHIVVVINKVLYMCASNKEHIVVMKRPCPSTAGLAWRSLGELVTPSDREGHVLLAVDC